MLRTENVHEAARLEAILGVERARAAAKIRDAMRCVIVVAVVRCQAISQSVLC